MKVPILPAMALLSLLALHSAQGAALERREEETTISNYALGSEAFNNQFLNIGKWKNNFNPEEFMNWHALMDFIKRSFPFLNWDAFPKLKGLRSAVPDAQ
ncbi:keratinocyte differentiation-associated protein isoform X1 [Octodon degus]|uniref:Keratinocyte differentiation-associated protein isoform X1 n=1 Tax=Octodon degus TaxID=10160 RepID=A0A6P6EY27_OCTDE|nr:keratinocyte differentiation-associated protein isoform X1 [Octodon degus]